MLTVVTKGPADYVTRFTADRSQGVIVLVSDMHKPGNFASAIDELESMEARTKAIGFANEQGVGDARINGSPGAAYPVNVNGVPLDMVRDEHGNSLPLTDKRMHVADYHIDIRVTRRLI
jgi:hypothetical protein